MKDFNDALCVNRFRSLLTFISMQKDKSHGG